MSGRETAKEVASRKVRVLKKGLFAKDLTSMMYGFGDQDPSADTVSVMEELLVEHITDICTQAHRISTNRGKIKIDDFKFALRNDPKKLARVEELLFMSEVIARARGKDDMTVLAEEEKEREAAAAQALRDNPPPPVPTLPQATSQAAQSQKADVAMGEGAQAPPKPKKKKKPKVLVDGEVEPPKKKPKKEGAKAKGKQKAVDKAPSTSQP